MDPKQPAPRRPDGDAPPTDAAISRRDLAAFGAGALAVAAARWLSGGVGVGGGGALELWAADRAAHAVLGLDQRGIVLRRIPVRAPVRVLSRGGGGVRVLSALDLWAGGRHERVEIDADGAVRSRSPAPAPRAAGRTAWPEAFAAAAAPRGLERAASFLAAPDEGDGVPRAWIARPAAGRDGHFVERWLARGRGPELGFRVLARGAAGPLVPAPRAGIWAIAARRLRVTSIDDRGRTAWSVEVRDAEGATAAVPARGGGAWIAARGALVRLGPDGERLPGQGGFAEIVDIARAV